MSAAAFTSLESEVLAITLRQAGVADAKIEDLLAKSRVTERQNTGHGFYTTFDADGLTPLSGRFMSGPVAYMEDMVPGMSMGFILWCDPGKPPCLEGFQNCDDRGETIDLFGRDLQTLSAIRMDWIG